MQGTLDYFSVIVLGENAQEKINKYDDMLDVEPYIIYHYKDRSDLKKIRINLYKEYLKNLTSTKDINYLKKKIYDIKNMSDDEFFFSLAEYKTFDENKNILSTENIHGKWLTCEKGGKIFSSYLKGFDDKPLIETTKKEINFDSIHLNKEEVYKFSKTWDLCVDKVTPINEKEEKIVENMKKFQNYFKNFIDKDTYVKVNTSFWSYAIINEDGEWISIDDYPQFEWIMNYYDNQIKPLSDNTKITIFECTK